MEVIIFIGIIAVALFVFYQWNKNDVPGDVVKTEQAPAVKEEVPYKVETPVPPEVAAIISAPAPAAEPVKAEPAKAKPARKTAAKKTVAKKTVAAKRPAAKKKSA